MTHHVLCQSYWRRQSGWRKCSVLTQSMLPRYCTHPHCPPPSNYLHDCYTTRWRVYWMMWTSKLPSLESSLRECVRTCLTGLLSPLNRLWNQPTWHWYTASLTHSLAQYLFQEEMDSVILFGGTTRVPKVQEKLLEAIKGYHTFHIHFHNVTLSSLPVRSSARISTQMKQQPWVLCISLPPSVNSLKWWNSWSRTAQSTLYRYNTVTLACIEYSPLTGCRCRLLRAL